MPDDANRTAPKNWGPWPPEQGRINAVVERAARTLARQIAGEEWASGVILLALPRSRDELNLSFTGKETEILVGHIRAVERHKGWMVFWAPATDTGRLHPIGVDDWRA
jgi:hypothetical protein